jgi:Transglycosylase SLT domain
MASKYLVRPELLNALIQAESGWNPNAVSNKGAQGLAQVMPATARDPGFGVKPLTSNDPREHLRFANDYLGALLDKFNGNEALAVAAYNAGPGAVSKHGGIPPFKETVNYVGKIGRMLNPIGEAKAETKPSGNAMTYNEQEKQALKSPNKAELAWEKYQTSISKPSTNPAETAWEKYQASMQQPKPGMAWSDVPGQAIENLPESTGNLFMGAARAVANPIDTISGLLNITSGELYKALPDGVSQRIQSLAMSPEKAGEVNASADAFNEFMANRYGGMEQLKQTIANDPAGFLSDLSVVLGGVGGLASKAGATNIGGKISKAGHIVNPMDVIPKGIKEGVGIISKEVLGRTTGVGSDAVSQAWKAGKTSNATFMDNLKGDVPMDEVLLQAKDGLSTIMANASQRYQQGMNNLGRQQGFTTIIPFQPIVDKFDDLKKTLGFQSPAGIRHSKIGSDEANIVHKLGSVVDEWSQDPSAHTPMGFDALKQKLDSIDVNYKTQRQAARVKTSLRKEVFDSINNASPEYKNVMKDYEKARVVHDEIERAFSLGSNASKDTALRKLQSLTRNNVQTNYGNRLNLAEQLKQYGGQDIMPAISGQTFNSWLSRGLAGNLENLATIGGAALHNPLISLLMAPQSPKLVGLATYGAGKASNYIPDFNPNIVNTLSVMDRYDTDHKKKK